VTDRADRFREAVKTFVRVPAAKRLVALGGVAPDLPEVLRRREAPGPSLLSSPLLAVSAG
jgi:hypothetical protein